MSDAKPCMCDGFRELIIPFGSDGYVALHEIVSASKVAVLAVRHQREEDSH